MKIYNKKLLMALFLAAFISGCDGCGRSNGSGSAVGTTGDTAGDTSGNTTGDIAGNTADTAALALTVSSTNPVDQATDVAINRKIVATFSEEVDPVTVSSTSFLVTEPGLTSVAGTVGMDAANHIATFTPSENLATGTLLTVTINREVEGLTGNVLASDYVWTFTTGETADTTAPTVSSTDPVDLDTDVAVNKNMAVSFSEGMDPLTIDDTTFLVTGPGSSPVAGTVGYAGNVATFNPDSDLSPNTLYSATITTGAMDLAGNALAGATIWSFTTGSTADSTAPDVISTNPADGDGSVALNKSITATFSESMNAVTITTASYVVTGPGTAPVTGVVDYDLASNVATFNPGSNLAPNTLFTATITTGVQDLAGNGLASSYVWTFTTGIEAAQTVAQASVPLGSSSNFAILASAAITNIPTSHIIGDVGLTPDAGSNISGFSDPLTCPEVTGTMYAVDTNGPACAVPAPTRLTDAKTDAETAFTNARAAVRGTPQAISGNLNGLTLYPGLYESGSSLEISPGGFLYLDAQGDGNAVFIIRSATSITTEATSEVVLTKGAKATNVYWTAGSTVTLGTHSIMKGTMVAGTSISLLTGANLEGRALNQGAAAEAITLDSCTITVPSP